MRTPRRHVYFPLPVQGVLYQRFSMCTYCMKTSRSLSLKCYTGHMPKQSKSPVDQHAPHLPNSQRAPVDQHAPHLPNSQRARWISMHLTSQTVKEPRGSTCTSPPKQSKSPVDQHAPHLPNSQRARWISMHLTSQTVKEPGGSASQHTYVRECYARMLTIH